VLTAILPGDANKRAARPRSADRTDLNRNRTKAMSHVYNEIQLTSFLDQILWRVSVIEAQLALISEQLELPHDDAASMSPAEVVELLVRARDRSPETKRRTKHDQVTLPRRAQLRAAR
jgi:hypothetical protein